MGDAEAKPEKSAVTAVRAAVNFILTVFVRDLGR